MSGTGRTRLVAVARAGYGALLVTRGIGIATAAVGRPLDRGEAFMVRFLGARHLAQAAATLARPALARPGALVDASHAASLVGIAAVSSRHRRIALLDLPVATTLAATS
jgi:hypothetical protein